MTSDSPVVLIVEPHADSAEMYSEMLTSFGLRPVIADDGLSAFALARELRPDLVVTDLALPGAPDSDLTRLLRGEGNDVAVIVLTARGFPDDQRQAMLMGC